MGLVKTLLTIAGINVEQKASIGCTPLALACQSSWEEREIVKGLINIGKADVNGRDKDGMTPLLHAISKGNRRVVEILLAAPDIDLTATNKNGWTAFLCAQDCSPVEIVDMLLATGKIDIPKAIIDTEDEEEGLGDEIGWEDGTAR